MPVAEYEHGDRPSGVVGGYVYRGTAAAPLVGHYLYGDIFGESIWALDSQNPGGPPELVFECPFLFASFAEDLDGELYVLAFDEGSIYRLTVADR